MIYILILFHKMKMDKCIHKTILLGKVYKYPFVKIISWFHKSDEKKN